MSLSILRTIILNLLTQTKKWFCCMVTMKTQRTLEYIHIWAQIIIAPRFWTIFTPDRLIALLYIIVCFLYIYCRLIALHWLRIRYTCYLPPVYLFILVRLVFFFCKTWIYIFFCALQARDICPKSAQYVRCFQFPWPGRRYVWYWKWSRSGKTLATGQKGNFHHRLYHIFCCKHHGRP